MLPRIEKMVNEQLEAEVMTCSSNESKTSHVVAANLSELELKKILIDKMERNKSIHRSNEQTNLYNALVEDYESDKLILETYGKMVTFKRRREDEDKDKEPSVGSNRGSKRRRAGKEPESTSALKEKTTKLSGKSNEGILAQKEDPRESFDELMDTPLDFSAFVMNRLNVDSLTLELLVGPTFDLMKGACKSLRKPLLLIPNSRGRRVIPFDHFINNDLEYLSGVVSSRKYATSVTKTNAADYGHIKWIEDFVPNIMQSPVLVDYDKHALWVTKLEIVEWQNYKHLDWIIVRNLMNLTVEECLAFNVSLRMFTRSIVIQRRVKDLQLGLESYQNKLNLTKPDTYKSDLKRRDAYSTYSTPRGFIYQNKDKKIRLMHIDELHKFSDGTHDDVRTALNDHLKGIRMQYLPQTIWRQRDKENARAMIQAIEKKLKTRGIMRSLEKFIGGRPYEGDFRLLQRTI
ncbi:hypothetical protein Tco_1179788 [Tanacetum coccineum]